VILISYQSEVVFEGELVKLMIGMANLKYYDQQVITTLAFQLRSDLETTSKEDVVFCFFALAKSGIRELGLVLDLLEYFLSGLNFDTQI